MIHRKITLPCDSQMQLSPLQRGLLHEYKLEYTEAKQCYQNAVSINPSHIKSLQHLVIIVACARVVTYY